MADDLRPYLHDAQALVEKHLRESLRLAEKAPSSLQEAMRYSLLAPGKRLRPLLVLLAAEASGGTAAAALPAASAVEMVHTYSLIHDDLPAMDDDDLRRGLPTCHKKFGEAMAILAGDALLTLAFHVLADGYPARTAAGCTLELARGSGAIGMVGGQVEDIASENCVDGTLAQLENIHALKTGALFRICLQLGLWSAQGERPAGVDRELAERLDGYGRCFGQLFQITDDLLDVQGDAGQTGKRVNKDAARGKLTYPGFLGVAESRRRAEQLADEAIEWVTPLSQAGDRLGGLVRMIIERDR